MTLILLLLLPAALALLCLLARNSSFLSTIAMSGSVATFCVSLYLYLTPSTVSISYEWSDYLGTHFALQADGVSKLLCLLCTISYVLVLMVACSRRLSNKGWFYALLLIGQSAMMGVFMATDGLLFYFFWEIALIPFYFLCSFWGGEKRIYVTYKFFVYTFVGSLLMLCGILYLYNHNAEHSFAIASLSKIPLSTHQQIWAFFLFFIAFAIKLPLFPFHTWQPSTYYQSNTLVTAILSGVMVKMGLMGFIRWLPVFKNALPMVSHLVVGLCVLGMLYASVLAIRQTNFKKLIAYASIAHIGLLCAALFCANAESLSGCIIQLFNHGIIVVGLWIVVDVIEYHWGTTEFKELGQLAKQSPLLTVLLTLLCLANMSLPLTSSFAGELLMFGGLFLFSKTMAMVAIVAVILVAVYTLWMLQKILYDRLSTYDKTDARFYPIRDYRTTLGAICIAVTIVLFFGFFPQLLIKPITAEALQISNSLIP